MSLANPSLNIHPSVNLAALIVASDKFLSEKTPSRLFISKLPKSYCFINALPSKYKQIFRFFQSKSSSDDSVENLKEIIGSKRLKRIFLKDELKLNLQSLDDHSVPLTKATVHKILIGLGDIHLKDLQELAAFKGKQLKDLNLNQLDDLFEELLPLNLETTVQDDKVMQDFESESLLLGGDHSQKVKAPPSKNDYGSKGYVTLSSSTTVSRLKKINQIFMKHCSKVDYFDKNRSPATTFKGLQERVWIILKAREQFINTEPNQLNLSEVEMLTSRLADREPPKGALLRLSQGYYVVDEIFAKGGAHIFALKEVSKTPPKTILVCRGTSFKGNLLSGLNDLLIEIGTLGIKKVWPDIKQYLQKNEIAEVEIMGKSLGGAHAQYLTTLIGGITGIQVTKLITNCSVGVPTSIQALFEKIIYPKKSPEIFILRNSGNHLATTWDYIPNVGGKHLYAPKKTRLYYISPFNFRGFSKEKESVVDKMRNLFQSFSRAHCRQTTLEPFHFYEHPSVKQEIQPDNHLEGLRSLVAYLIDLASLGTINGETFEEFYHKEAMNKHR